MIIEKLRSALLFSKYDVVFYSLKNESNSKQAKEI